MLKISIFGKVLLSFIGALSVVLLIALLDLSSTQNLVVSYQKVEHSHKIINQLELIISLLKDGETGQRGYVITQNDLFLEPFHQALSHIHRELTVLDSLLARNGTPDPRFTPLFALIQEKIDFIQYTTELVRQADAPEARTLIASGQGKAVMDEVRQMVQQMKDQEETVLQDFAAQVSRNYRFNQYVVYLGIGIISLILLFGTLRLYRELKVQRTLKDNLQTTNAQLGHMVSDLNHANQEMLTINEELNAANEMMMTYAHQLETRSHELEQSNQELEAFSYTISHDLLSPMRSIAGYSEVLVEEYQPHLDTEGKRLINKIATNTQRMNRLIHGLLEFSRVGKKGLEKVHFSMEKLVAPLLEEFQEAYAAHPVSVKLHPLPTVYAEAELLKQAWVNLISNAFKFTTKVPNPSVEIGYQPTAQNYQFYIRDNGAGFDMKHAEKKLFGVFRRMHTKEEFEGTGVGLAITHRIIASHNGSIWADSAPGQGATFYFTLPRTD